ncbi:hypothetical protein Dsin_009959 [Dipteronia sinensis]|uniref:Reverse transcriptase n=1 Tax=Dipteronia sinensis TaxID=43782 RepID=A0AAE0ASS7_9ROSI|nr:hypothetical protein Dsin_009959 [Dipteronia sinensis]
MEKDKDMEGIIQKYFSTLFTSSKSSSYHLDSVLDTMEARLPLNMKDFLDSAFSMEDVREALFQMDPLKSPGIDGFPVDFYQRFWSVVGKDVSKVCLECLNEGHYMKMINHFLLCLIPKMRNVERFVERMSDVRLISLCNVIYKCVSKALANRLRKFFGFVIADSQSAFIPGRLITDNAMVGFECIHALRRKVNGKKKVSCFLN